MSAVPAPRVLVLGAGGTGGYFGGRLAQAGAGVVFLVRAPRAARLRAEGLRLRSALGDADIAVDCTTADALPARAARAPFDLVLLACKAYDLDTAVDAIAPAVGAATAVLPVLNGLRHYPVLDARFGVQRVLGGLSFISAVLDGDGTVRHLPSPARLTFGERSGDPRSARVAAFSALCTRAGIEHVASDAIHAQVWGKFAFLCTLAAATCTMRTSVGGIVATGGGADWMRALYAECAAVSAAAGQPLPAQVQAQALDTLLAPGSTLKASMLRDLEGGGRTEAAHIVGDLHARACAAGLPAPLLGTAWIHLQAYEAARARP